ncbi:BQ2448_1114 [Microbotryum intermedium]|uniref:BQ2448_1114 protein n=1 Tax=Microbotryum intermedium TaxID=269621 RepID=A0A238F787_9BASI|nr:BQ2448_1114 [Microbotryum intermedium]
MTFTLLSWHEPARPTIIPERKALALVPATEQPLQDRVDSPSFTIKGRTVQVVVKFLTI